MFRRNWSTAIVGLTLGLTASPILAFAQPAAGGGAVQAVRSSGDREYVLGVGDSIEVGVLGRTDFSGRTRVGTDGSIMLPYLGTVPALGRSPAQLAEEVRIALEKGGFFAQPTIRIDVVAVASRFVTALGALGAPGLLALDRQYHLSEIVARAGGRTAAGADYVVLTNANGESKQYKIADLATAVGDKDPMVTSGDKVYIPAAENEVFYVTGQVRSAGAFPATENLTVRMALARGGGLSETGSEKKVKINRKGVDLKGVKLDETVVQAGDVITVGERLF